MVAAVEDDEGKGEGRHADDNEDEHQHPFPVRGDPVGYCVRDMLYTHVAGGVYQFPLFSFSGVEWWFSFDAPDVADVVGLFAAFGVVVVAVPPLLPPARGAPPFPQ